MDFDVQLVGSAEGPRGGRHGSRSIVWIETLQTAEMGGLGGNREVGW